MIDRVDPSKPAGGDSARVPPTGPWDPPPPKGPRRDGRTMAPGRRVRVSSIAFAALMLLGFGASAYKDLSRPEAWAYWKDLYFAPSLIATHVPAVAVTASGEPHPALVVSGQIGAAAARLFRDRLDDAHLAAGDPIILSSPGGNIDQALIIGEIIRSRRLATAVGIVDASGHLHASYCASACVIAFAGGTPRVGVPGSILGVHRFTSDPTDRDAVASTQGTAGRILGYMTRMGVSSRIIEAMSATDDVRWLATKDAAAMHLVTDPPIPSE